MDHSTEMIVHVRSPFDIYLKSGTCTPYNWAFCSHILAFAKDEGRIKILGDAKTPEER